MAKGFISLGLEESHSVGVMANNCVQWSVSSIATIFAGGLISGIYQTSSSDIVHHVAHMADMDILVVEDLAMLKQALGSKRSIKEALPMVKTCVMIKATEDQLVKGKYLEYAHLESLKIKRSDTRIVFKTDKTYIHDLKLFTAKTYGPVISWNELVEIGETAPNSILEDREKGLQPNKACMLIFTSGTTGPPKGDAIHF